MKYIDANRLKAEIERLKEETTIGICEYDKGEENGRFEVLNHLLSTITSLQQEQPSEDLEKASEESWAVYEYRETPRGLYSSCYVDGFKAGAQWQKEQMMKDAVEGYVNYYEDSGGILMAEAQVGCPYHNGDKVKIIIVKENEK